MDVATIPAWWGSVTGTVALVWQVFRWYRSGPRLKLSVGTNMEIISPGERRDGTLHVLLTVRNVGDAPTTVTHVCGHVYSSRLKRLLRRKDKVFIITPSAEIPLPHKLDPGETWTTHAFQRDFLAYPPGSIILFGVQHSMAEKPQLVLVRNLAAAG